MYTSLICVSLGLFLVVLVIAIYIRIKKITHEGVETKGIIFSSENTGSVNLRFTFPIIRFITEKGEWITERYNLSLFAYKLGQKVTVIYRTNKPSEFIIKSKSNYIVLMLLGVVGLALFSFGIISLV